MLENEIDTLDTSMDESEDIPFYEDHGCSVYTSCLSCPLPSCVEDVGINEAIQLAWGAYVDLPSFRTYYSGRLSDIPPGLDRAEFIGARTNPRRPSDGHRALIVHRFRSGESKLSLARDFHVSPHFLRRLLKGEVNQFGKHNKYAQEGKDELQTKGEAVSQDRLPHQERSVSSAEAAAIPATIAGHNAGVPVSALSGPTLSFGEC